MKIRDSEQTRRGAGSASLELVILTPVMMLLMLLVLWAGRVGRAELAAVLAAEEAAVAAGVACAAGQWPGIALQQQDSCAETVAADVLRSRPGLSDLCIGGPRPLPSAGSGRATDEGLVTLRGPLVVVAVACDTDGAVAPLRGLFPTVQFQGHATYVVPTSR